MRVHITQYKIKVFYEYNIIVYYLFLHINKYAYNPPTVAK